MRAFLIGSCVACSLLVGGFIGWRSADAKAPREETEGLSRGQRPPAFAVTDLRGQRQSLKQYRGQLVVLHFWATWCPYCRGEIPKLLEVHQRASEQGVVVLAVSVDDDLAQLQAFVEQTGLPYSVIPAVREHPPLPRLYGIRGVPVTYLLDRDGRIAYRFFGSADLIGALQRLLAQSAKT